MQRKKVLGTACTAMLVLVMYYMLITTPTLPGRRAASGKNSQQAVEVLVNLMKVAETGQFQNPKKEKGSIAADKFRNKDSDVLKQVKELLDTVYQSEDHNMIFRAKKLLNDYAAKTSSKWASFWKYDPRIPFSPESYSWKPAWRDNITNFQKFASNFECLNNVWCDTWYDEAEGELLQKKLWDLQHPANCSEARILYMELLYSGMGSTFHTIASALAVAYNTNRTLVIAELGDTFVSPDKCAQFGVLSCYMRPLSSCVSKDIQLLSEDVGRLKNISAINKRILLVADNPCPYDLLPNDYKHKGVFWWRAQSARYLSRPRQSLINFVDEQKKTIFKSNNGEIPHPIISIHVRHGDKHTEANIFPLKDYMTAALKIKQKTGVSNIFLSTEDEAVVSQAINEYSSEFNIYYQPIPRLNISPFYSQQELGPTAEALIAYTSLFVGLECDVMIGTRSSNFCRWMDELRKVFGKARIPYYSIDYYGYEVGGWQPVPQNEAHRIQLICGVTLDGQPTLYDGNLISSGQKPSPLKSIDPLIPLNDTDKYVDLFKD